MTHTTESGAVVEAAETRAGSDILAHVLAEGPEGMLVRASAAALRRSSGCGPKTA
jgi:hypothetical protein